MKRARVHEFHVHKSLAQDVKCIREVQPFHVQPSRVRLRYLVSGEVGRGRDGNHAADDAEPDAGCMCDENFDIMYII